MKTLCILALLTVAFFSPRVAYADSDGYYGIGSGYLAYQIGLAAPPTRPHHLYVIGFADAARISPSTMLDLPQFQVHGIICGERTIQLVSYDDLYTVRLNAKNQPVGYESTPLAKRGQSPPQFAGPSLNPAALSEAANNFKTQRISLGSVKGGGQFLLEISARRTGRCTSSIASRIIRTDRNGREVERLDIFQGLGNRKCGE